jgi:hypothetical protein
MLKLTNLFIKDPEPEEWLNKKRCINTSIDTVLTNGSYNEDILLMMKSLLKEIKITSSIHDFIEENN